MTPLHRFPPPALRRTGAPLARALRSADAVALPVTSDGDGPRLGAGAEETATVLGLDLPRLAERVSASGNAGDVAAVPVAVSGSGVEQVLLVGVGDGSPAALRRAGAALARRAAGRQRVASTVASGSDASARRAFAEGVSLGGYRFSLASAPRGAAPVVRVDLVGWPDDDAVMRGQATAAAVRLARDLGNTPADRLGPPELAARAQRLGAAAGLDVRVLDDAALARGGFGGLLAVGAGSSRPPRLVELRYRPDGTTDATPHVVLVGKGITFDSGGLSLKPADAMVPMKTDMAGAAAVVAVATALPALGVPVRVTAVAALAENLPSGSALRPGDVVTHYDGRTVEVMNTDAEGRLVLADALGYAAARLSPDALVDVATLTGAASVALGRRQAALYASDDALAAALLEASAAGGEPVWRMPLLPDLEPALASPVADLSNTSRVPSVGAGSVTAALFLRAFTAGLPWAHLDIAGPGRAEADDGEVSRGATGFGVRLLLRWLERADGVRRARTPRRG